MVSSVKQRENTVSPREGSGCDSIGFWSLLPPVEWCFDPTGQKESFPAADPNV